MLSSALGQKASFLENIQSQYPNYQQMGQYAQTQAAGTSATSAMNAAANRLGSQTGFVPQQTTTYTQPYNYNQPSNQTGPSSTAGLSAGTEQYESPTSINTSSYYDVPITWQPGYYYGEGYDVPTEEEDFMNQWMPYYGA
jgi:hypothetical protein